MSGRAAAVAIEGGALPLGGGLLALLRPALRLLEPGGVLAVLSSNAEVGEDLPVFCRVEHHRYLDAEDLGGGRRRHLIERGSLGVALGRHEAGFALAREPGRYTSERVLAAVPMPERADPTSGFAPRGAQVEAGGPAHPYDLVERDRVAPPDVAQLYDQAVIAQWDASRDVPWNEVGRHEPALEAAVGQIMTFLAENELSALYVPSKFVARTHPAFAETAMFLATQMNDEARHIDVFLKRARAAGGGLGLSAVTTSRSLLSLLELEDFTEAAFLLSVLGEGTFLDLLRYVEDHAPDAATAVLASRARADEARHVHFGMSHVRHALATDPSLYPRLEAAVRRRAATLAGVGEAPVAVQDALVVYAAGGSAPSALVRGHESYRELLETMHENRVKRLRSAGFSEGQAQTISDLHSPNFM
jgi:TusA-related sulfurtransferase